MFRRLIALFACVAAIFAVSAAPASAHTKAVPAATVIGTPGDLAVGTFHRKLRGVSAFVDNGAGQVQVYGSYVGLRPNSPRFTVIYANKNCDPAQAFPVGPFTTDNRGRATLSASVALPAGVDVGKTGSVSVRRGDVDGNGNPTDQDGDGLTGPTDVIAVAGKPAVGLVECDSTPLVRDLS